ncbi:MAG: DUF4326 domain-containing protein [Motiliproteus sp.]
MKHIEDLAVCYPHDNNLLIASYFSEHRPEVELLEYTDNDMSDLTHAIVFDDGEEFASFIGVLKEKNIKIRVVKISITRVVNIKRDEQFIGLESTKGYEYVGRGSYWGNPYSMYEEGEDRDEVIRKYKYDFDYEKFPNKEKCQVYRLAGKRLGCFCKPQVCHADVLADFLNAWDDGK